MLEKIATALLQTRQVQQQQVIVNGVPQGGQIVNQYFIQCSYCNRILGQFNPGDPVPAVIKICKDQVSKDLIYCPTCGSKLHYGMDIIAVKEEKHE